MKLNISEIFRSIQGEGPETGEDVIFVRFSGCNLRCRWGEDYCDTPYTSWTPEKKLIELSALIPSVEEIGGECKKIVITGGEPTIHPGLPELCLQLKTRGYRLSIETNGRGPIPEEISCVVCSPKLTDSIPLGSDVEALHRREHAILDQGISGSEERVYLKFVISELTPIDEMQRTVNERGFPADRVYLMPLGTTAELLDRNMSVVEALSQRYGYAISDRLHIRKWGNVRGR